jgi:type VI secretion system ImpM family protein
MSVETLETASITVIGWYGKLPAVGDFLRYKLPDTFVDGWDAWLREGMSAAEREQGEDWQDRFLRVPVWYFLRRLPAADGSLWAGVLVPSVDRVGRLFPLTVAFEVPSQDFLNLGLDPIENRLKEIEGHTLNVLGNDDLPGFEQALSSLNAAAIPQDCAQAATPRALIEDLGRQALLERLANQAVFWAAGDASTQTMLTLPEPLQAKNFCKLMLPASPPIPSE